MGIQNAVVTVECDQCGEREIFTDITTEHEIYERIYDNGWITVESVSHGQGMNLNNSIFTTFYCSPDCLPFPQSAIIGDKNGKIATFNTVAFCAGVDRGNLLFLRHLERVEAELSAT